MSGFSRSIAVLPKHLWFAFGLIQITCLFVILQNPQDGPEMFQRFGSLVICASVFFLGTARISIDYSEQHWVAANTKTYESTKQRHSELEAKLKAVHGPDDAYVHTVKAENAEFLAKLSPERVSDEAHASRVRWLIAEFFTLIVGTIQWGFGDLLFDLIFGGNS